MPERPQAVFAMTAQNVPHVFPPEVLAEADGFVFATGTYWDSWGSPLQKFLEETTAFEGTSVWLGMSW